jgi:hypothetical protein
VGHSEIAAALVPGQFAGLGSSPVALPSPEPENDAPGSTAVFIIPPPLSPLPPAPAVALGVLPVGA